MVTKNQQYQIKQAILTKGAPGILAYNLSDPQFLRRFFSTPHQQTWWSPTNTPHHIQRAFLINSPHKGDINHGLEEDTKKGSITEGYTARRNIRALHHSWTRGPSVANRTLSIYRIKNERPNGTNKSRERNAIL